eukprot:3874499-Rhodomonas_salina.1
MSGTDRKRTAVPIRPQKYIGEISVWDEAEAQLKRRVAMPLCPCYAMSGTDKGYAATTRPRSTATAR